MELRRNIKFLATGAKALDKLIGGGYETQSNHRILWPIWQLKKPISFNSLHNSPNHWTGY